MKVSSLYAILVWFCWQFNSPVEASYSDTDLMAVSHGSEDLLTAALKKELSMFTRRLDDIAIEEHQRSDFQMFVLNSVF